MHLGSFGVILGLTIGHGEAEMQVLLADDQAKVRSALRLLLEHRPKVEILGKAVDTTGLAASDIADFDLHRTVTETRAAIVRGQETTMVIISLYIF